VLCAVFRSNSLPLGLEPIGFCCSYHFLHNHLGCATIRVIKSYFFVRWWRSSSDASMLGSSDFNSLTMSTHRKLKNFILRRDY
jgi:hypothetical protein